MNFVNATKFAIELAKSIKRDDGEYFTDQDIVIIGGGGAKYSPSLKHYEFFDSDLSEFKENNKCLILVRVLEHVDLLKYPYYFQDIAKNGNYIVAVTPNMLKTYLRLKPNISEIGNSLFMLSYTLFGQGDEYNDAHKWFSDSDTIKRIKCFKTTIHSELLIDTIPHLVTIHTPKCVEKTNEVKKVSYILPDFRIGGVSLGSVESVIELLKVQPELRNEDLYVNYMFGCNDPVKNLDDVFMLAYGLQSLEFKGKIIFTELNHGKIIKGEFDLDVVNELMYPLKFKTYIDEDILVLYLTENKDFEILEINEDEYYITFTCKISE